MRLGDEQIERYSRQIILPEVGGIGQQRLLAAHVLVAGDNPAAEWVAIYLAAAGVGRLTLTPPRPATAERIAALNPEVRIVDAAASFDVTVVCDHRLGGLSVPLVAVGPAGVTVAVEDRPSPCAACAVAWSAPLRGARGGEEARSAALQSVAVTEVLKLILGLGTPLAGRLLKADLTEEAVTCLPSCPRSAS